MMNARVKQYAKGVAVGLFSLPILWLGAYLTWSTVRTVMAFEIHREKTPGKIVDVQIDQRCFQPSGGRLSTCSDVLKIEYSFLDSDNTLRTDFETVELFWTSEAAYAEALRQSTTREVTYNTEQPTESTIFPWRKRIFSFGSIIFSLVFLAGGFLGLYSAFHCLRVAKDEKENKARA